MKLECMEELLERTKPLRGLGEAVLVQIPQVPPEQLDRDTAGNRGYFAYPPGGLLYLSATLRKLGIGARIVDLNYAVLRRAREAGGDVGAVWKEVLKEALGTGAGNRFVCISYMFDVTWPWFRKICGYIKEKWPDTCLAAGGVGATADPERILTETGVDLVFSHEGEEALEGFFAFVGGETDSLPRNLSFVESDGTIVHTEIKTGGPVDCDIREEYHKIPIEDYCKVGSLSNYSRMNGVDVPFAAVQSRRGCRGHCSFCSVRSAMGPGVRVRPVDAVIEEMAWLYDRFGIRHFDWLDDDLLFNGKKALDLFEKMASRMPDATWAANNGLLVRALTPELMRAMEKSGCVGFKVGLESGNAEILERVRKPITLDGFSAFAEMARGFPGIFISVNFILGIPGETFSQLTDSFDAAMAAGLDWNNFYLFQPIKNTDLFTDVGGVECGGGIEGLGKEGVDVNLNPVRGGAFSGQGSGRLLSGYDVFHIPSETVPSRRQLNEIWFTFNAVANFLSLPALTTPSEKRLRNAVEWVRVLSGAYPEDASMLALLYFLSNRLSDRAPSGLDALRDKAWGLFRNSSYWGYRDRQFHFSAFLDGVIPEKDGRREP